ncbi:hypothetical protein KLP40_08460 [Hymenobacter sp. NST-14]|uniref:hypothetical protein n=1 Tax=Hymenobacter piscis TaxID=2839984 RepID=UPI001C0334F7|nr:hypothetical protein [Hymenobacter piscis]MBT9393194.1 hypothetical protein [Hymenobacter piscis]
MKLLLFAVALLGGPVALAQPAPAALAHRINQLMRDPAEPETELKVVLTDCHITQRVRQYRARPKADATTVQVSHQKNGGNWSVRTDGAVAFELTLGSEWRQVAALTYTLHHADKTGAPYYVVTVNRRTQSATGSANTTLELPLYTADEALVRDVVGQLEQLRRGCGGPQ